MNLLMIAWKVWIRFTVIIAQQINVDNKCLIILGVCKLYEDKLFKKLDPNTYSVTYDIPLLFKFIDNLTDISCLV